MMEAAAYFADSQPQTGQLAARLVGVNVVRKTNQLPSLKKYRCCQAGGCGGSG